MGRKEIHQDQENKIIDIHAQMHGSLSFSDPVSLRINGKFHGSLDTKGTLTIGEKAEVEAMINGENVIIAGKVKGDVAADKMLTLLPTAILQGNIKTPKLNIVEGAIFQGNCQMREDLLNIDEVAKYLEIDLKEIEELANSGKIPATRTGNVWKFEREQIDHWASSGKVERSR